MGELWMAECVMLGTDGEQLASFAGYSEDVRGYIADQAKQALLDGENRIQVEIREWDEHGP